jgi:putative endonuclease
MGFYVYILANATDEELYKGFTENPVERLLQHNRGETKFTASKKNWRMIALFLFFSKKEALIFEKKIKRWNRRSLDKLITSSQNIVSTFIH